MINQLLTYFRILLATGTLCAVMGSPVAAQDFYGQRGDISLSQRNQIQHVADLPVRVLWADTAFSESKLQYGNKSGNFRSYQHPESAQKFSLSSRGLTSFKDIRIEGAFQYRKELKNEVGWKLVRDAYHEPYYFGNIRPGDWDNDRYRLQLNGGTTFLDDRLLVALGVDYQVEQLARYNDPRPSINYYNLFWKSQLGWRFGHHSLAAHYGSGEADENGSVTNYDRANDSFGQREYNIITVSGLGSYNLRRRNSYEKPSHRQEVGLSYQFGNDDIKLTAEAVAGRTNTSFSRREMVGGSFLDVDIGKYFEEYMQGKLFLSVPRSNHKLQFLSQTYWSDGYDENTRFGGANYFHQDLQQELRAFYFDNDQSLALQAGFQYNNPSFTDRNASHSYSYQRLSADISGQYTIVIGPRQLTLISGLSHATALDSDISVPESSRNLLTKYLMSPDYYLHTTDVLGLNGGFQIKQKLKNFAVALLVDYHHKATISEGIVFGQPEFMPGTNRNTLSVTLQFFH